MQPRTEDQILSKSPNMVRLGNAEYPFKPLPIIKARAWRQLLVKIMADVSNPLATGTPASKNVSMSDGLLAALVVFPERITELVFEWCPDLPQQTILEEATEDEMSYAFRVIMLMAYPFLAQLVTTMQVTKSQSK